MPENAVSVANYFVSKSLDTGELLTPMKILKLTYIAHGWNLAVFDRALLSEGVQAWKFGPVVPSVYRAFKDYGSNSVTALGNDLFGCDEVDESVTPLLNRVWETYKKYSGTQLSSLTHQANTPWAQTVAPYKDKGELPPNLVIPNDTIKAYYKKLSHAGAGA
jgi:uncharacterized phage-associated protein